MSLTRTILLTTSLALTLALGGACDSSGPAPAPAAAAAPASLVESEAPAVLPSPAPVQREKVAQADLRACSTPDRHLPEAQRVRPTPPDARYRAATER
jgi:hypothetical protein